MVAKSGGNGGVWFEGCITGDDMDHPQFFLPPFNIVSKWQDYTTGLLLSNEPRPTRWVLVWYIGLYGLQQKMSIICLFSSPHRFMTCWVKLWLASFIIIGKVPLPRLSWRGDTLCCIFRTYISHHALCLAHLLSSLSACAITWTKSWRGTGGSPAPNSQQKPQAKKRHHRLCCVTADREVYWNKRLSIGRHTHVGSVIWM